MEIEELVLISEISKKPGSITSSALDTKSDHLNLWTLQILVQGFQKNVEMVKLMSLSWDMFDFIGKAIGWSDAEITVVHVVSGLTPDHWNSKVLFFSFLLSTNEEFQQNFCKEYAVFKLWLDHPISYQSMHSMSF